MFSGKIMLFYSHFSRVDAWFAAIVNIGSAFCFQVYQIHRKPMLLLLDLGNT